MPKRNFYHNRGDFFWAKQEDNETPEEHWKKLITLDKTQNEEKKNAATQTLADTSRTSAT